MYEKSPFIQFGANLNQLIPKYGTPSRFWPKVGLPQMPQIWDFFRSDFSTLLIDEPKLIET